jgi:hypothetical protein
MLTYFKAIRPKPGYNVDDASTSKPHTAELFATVRDNGRILDDFRCVVGGHAIFEASFELGKVMEDPSIAGGLSTCITRRGVRESGISQPSVLLSYS